MNLLSLPDDVKNVIFSMLHWKMLDNVRLTCRAFYLFLDRNHCCMDKRHLREMYVYCHKWKPNMEIIGIKYRPYMEPLEEYSRDYESLREPKRIHFTELYLYRHFVQKFDFTKLINLHFIINSKTDVINLFNNCFSHGNHLSEVILEFSGVPNEMNINDVLEFLLKIEKTKKISLKFTLPKKDIFENSESTVSNDLEEVNVDNNNTTESTTAKLIGYLIYNSPESCRFYISSKIDGFYTEIIRNFLEIEEASLKSVCKHTSKKVISYGKFSAIMEDVICELFTKSNYEVVQSWSGDKRTFYLMALKNCPVCGILNSLYIEI